MKLNDLTNLLIAISGSAAAFLAVSAVQESLIERIDVGVSAPYLPAGVRLVAVAVFGLVGAFGLFLASLWQASTSLLSAGWATLLAIALVSGFTPLLALMIVRRCFGIGEGLHELSFRSLLVLIALMSVLSPLAHQLLFLLTGVAPASLYNLLAMISGDVVGCMLVVLAVAAVWGWMARRPGDRD